MLAWKLLLDRGRGAVFVFILISGMVEKMDFPIRINKYLRDQGLASRREVDKRIEAGEIRVNGKRATPGMMIQEHDKVEIREETHPRISLAYYKPRGLATQGTKGMPSVIEEWRAKGLFPVGRLDKESEGLLILTNDGRLTTALVGGEMQIEKEYLVEVREPLRKGIPAIFEKGMDTKTFGKLLPAKAELQGEYRIRITLREGKHHQIRVMLSELGYTVTWLKRVRIGSITLGGLKPGETRSLKEKEHEALVRSH